MSLKNQACRGACVASVAASEQVACQGACVAEHWTVLPDLMHKAPRWLARKQKRRHKSAAGGGGGGGPPLGPPTGFVPTWTEGLQLQAGCDAPRGCMHMLWACVMCMSCRVCCGYVYVGSVCCERAMGMRGHACASYTGSRDAGGVQRKPSTRCTLRSALCTLHATRCLPHAARRTPHSALCTLQAEYIASLSLRDACAVFFTDDKSRLRTTTLTPSH